MSKLFQKLYNHYDSSSVLRFLLSYVLVLLLPLCVALIGFGCAFSVVRADIYKANQHMLEHTSALFENELNAVRLCAEQITRSDKLLALSSEHKSKPEFILDAMDALEAIFALPGAHEIPLLNSYYVSLFEPEYVFAHSALYDVATFASYISAQGLSVAEKYTKISADLKRLALQTC